ncbi:MAG: hypothetical protein OXF74_06320 [Rhodobacteraceae bacterium]|nr:hypothetical protein [Paracoccaceae bacterium]
MSRNENVVVAPGNASDIQGDWAGREIVEVSIGVPKPVMCRATEYGEDTIRPLGNGAWASVAMGANASRPQLSGSSTLLERLLAPGHHLAGLPEPLRLIEITCENAGGVTGLAKLRCQNMERVDFLPTM